MKKFEQKMTGRNEHHAHQARQLIRQKKADIATAQKGFLIAWLYGIYASRLNGYIKADRDYYWIKNKAGYELLVDRNRLFKGVSKLSAAYQKSADTLYFEAMMHQQYSVLNEELRPTSILVKRNGKSKRFQGYRFHSNNIDQALARTFDHPLQMLFYAPKNGLTVDY